MRFLRVISVLRGGGKARNLLCVIGTLLNVAGILLGALFGLARRKPLPPSTEGFFKVLLGAFTVFYGLRLTWSSLNGSPLQILKQLTIAVLALMIGKVAGRGLGLQKMSNRLGGTARDRMTAASAHDPRRASQGFKTCAVLFCAAPLGILGAVQDGLSDYYYPLAVKAVMDGLAALAFVPMFGWGVMFSAVPVLAFQGSITLLCARWLGPFLAAHGLSADAVNGAGGLLVFSIALVILGLKKIHLADYLPSLVFAPLIAWIWR